MADFIARIKRTVEVEEEVPLLIWQWTIERGDSTTPSEINILLRPVDEEGKWIEEAQVLRANLKDDISNEDPMLQRLVTTLIDSVILDSIIPETPFTKQFGIAGQPIRDGGQVILRAMGQL